jgi:hypothetical protein
MASWSRGSYIPPHKPAAAAVRSYAVGRKTKQEDKAMESNVTLKSNVTLVRNYSRKIRNDELTETMERLEWAKSQPKAVLVHEVEVAIGIIKEFGIEEE